MLSNPNKVHREKHDEHYTPVELIQLAYDILGPIDLDPATSSVALGRLPEHLLPHSYFTKDDPSPKVWDAKTVWCNPPFSLTRYFIDAAIRSAEENGTVTMFLMPANMSTKYIQGIFQELAAKDLLSPILFHNGRVKFFDGVDMEIGTNPPGSTCIFLIGADVRTHRRFVEQAKNAGHLVLELI